MYPGLRFQGGNAEKAIKHVYDPATRRWSASTTTVSLSPRPFQEGTMRVVFDLIDHSLPSGHQQCVAKMSKDPYEPRETYFAEVEMQYKCKDYARKFNLLNLPKRIDFLEACILELPQRRTPAGAPFIVQVEPKLKGCYTKHSNNFGFVSPEDRNTPQAFSHWTWVASGGRELVCDIQGVGDLYTDPQIHSNAGHENYLYGKGDMGMEGIHQFFASHRCNALCRSLGLPPPPGPQMPRFGFETGTTARGRVPSPVQDYNFARPPMSYSPASLSPASSVGGISTGSGGFVDHLVVHRLPVGDFGLSFPQVALPIIIAV